MLEYLSIRNYALIEEVNFNFKSGFNVFSGETGAGKSILVDALSLALGARGNSENIRDGANEAEIRVLIHVTRSPELLAWQEKYGIESEEDSYLIRRTLSTSGRGISSIQAVPVTRTAVAELASVLVDIHGQHEHQSLFKVVNHRKLLDRFAGIEPRVESFTSLFTEFSELKKLLENIDSEEERISREMEFLRHAAGEIEEAQLRVGEEEKLENRQRILSGHANLLGDIERALDSTAETRNGALLQLRAAREALERASKIDKSLSEILARLEESFFEIEDIGEELKKRHSSVEFNPSELEIIDDRLLKISLLEKKYNARSVSELIEYLTKLRKQLEIFDNRDSERRALGLKREALGTRVASEASAISLLRKEAAQSLQKEVQSHLRTLGMEDARFVVELVGKKNSNGKSLIGAYGADTIEFLLSANKGESPKALKSVASGGELSRVMLAIKTVLSESDTVQTMIFDEIDSGIGGEVARSVGGHLHGLSSQKQVFCVTHLASIAVFADNHLQVGKKMKDGRTIITVREVMGDSRVREIARMLAGDSKETFSLDYAASLLEERSRMTGRTNN